MTSEKDFIIGRKDARPEKYVVVKYRFQTPGNFINAAVDLSKEQSFSYIEDPIKEKKFIKKFAAKVI